jgi:hypothetical protein
MILMEKIIPEFLAFGKNIDQSGVISISGEKQ